jgi:hypothetical protein
MDVKIPYKPRPLQKDMHKELKRWNVLVMHRRFGKTVWAVNQLIKTTLTCPLPRPRTAFVAPTFAQRSYPRCAIQRDRTPRRFS